MHVKCRPSRRSEGEGLTGLLLGEHVGWQVLHARIALLQKGLLCCGINRTRPTLRLCFLTVMWFRNDLRVHDNQALAMALRESTSLLPLYCFDPREYSSTVNGVNTTGPYRAQ